MGLLDYRGWCCLPRSLGLLFAGFSPVFRAVTLAAGGSATRDDGVDGVDVTIRICAAVVVWDLCAVGGNGDFDLIKVASGRLLVVDLVGQEGVDQLLEGSRVIYLSLWDVSQSHSDSSGAGLSQEHLGAVVVDGYRSELQEC